jgi:succinate-acetate transporter protein
VSESDVQSQTVVAVPTPREAGRGPVDEVPPDVAAAPAGDPLVIGLPAFIAGSVGLALVDLGFAPLTASGAAVPVIMTATSLGLFIAAVWAARLAQDVVAAVLAVFGGFWLSYAALSLGLQHGWFAVQPAGVNRTVEIFLITWLVVIGLLTLGSLRLPSAYSALFVLVDVALVLTLVATAQASTGLTKTAGWAVVAFAAVGAYVWLSALSVATGGRAFPLGRPLVR